MDEASVSQSVQAIGRQLSQLLLRQFSTGEPQFKRTTEQKVKGQGHYWDKVNCKWLSLLTRP
jgi:hypothetical protein